MDDLRARVFKEFDSSWERPANIPLTTDLNPPYQAKGLLQSRNWRDVDSRALANVPSALLELTPPWFAYYTPLTFLIALEEVDAHVAQMNEIPEEYRVASDWEWTLTLLIPGSHYEGCFAASGAPSLTAPKIELLIRIARHLDEQGYTRYEEDFRGTFADKFTAFLASGGPICRE
jgi:hypothetical protein